MLRELWVALTVISSRPSGAGGTSSNSITVTAKPVPPPPSTPPANVRINTTVTSTNQSALVIWSPVSGAVGYILYRTTNSPNGPFTFPANYVLSMTTTNYTDGGLMTNTLYSYLIVAMNAGGVSGNSIIVSTPPAAPASLNAYPGNSQIALSWSASIGATNYVILRGTNSGNETLVVAGTTNTTYTDTGLLNGTNYFYVVYAVGTGGNSLYSPEASAAPFAGPPPVYWINAITTSAQGWNVNSNWSNGSAFPNATQATAIVNAPIATGQTVILNQAITVGTLSLGAAGGSFTLAPNAGSFTFDNSPAAATLAELPASKGDTISAPITVNGSLLVTNPTANTLTLSGGISGSNVVISGYTLMSGTNTYTGGTTVNSGRLTFNVGAAIPASGTLTLNNTGAVTVVTANGLPNVLVNGNNAITGNGNSGTSAGTVNVAGTLTLFVSGGSDVFDLTGTMTGAGNLVLGSSPMTLRFNGTAGDANALFNLGTGSAVASVRNTLTSAIALGGLTGGSSTQLQGDNSGGVNLTYTIGGANVDTEFDGAIKDGTSSTALIKTGTGTLTLTSTNTYSGGTTINAGTLQINNLMGSGTGSGTVTVANGGTLAGNGVIAGAVTVSAGGALSPGNPLGTLAISNNLTLAADSTTFMRVQHSPLTNDAVKISGMQLAGGTLNVTNLGGPLANGDSFKLFSASNYSGSFAGFVLPPLATNLVWNTNALKISGTLSVAAYGPPVIGAVTMTRTNLSLSGSGGIPYWTYYVLAATNLGAPQWLKIATNQFDAAGSFMLSNALNVGQRQTFYRLQLQ